MSVHVTPDSAGWGYSGLRVIEVDARSEGSYNTGPDETIVVPLAGACTVVADGRTTSCCQVLSKLRSNVYRLAA